MGKVRNGVKEKSVLNEREGGSGAPVVISVKLVNMQPVAQPRVGTLKYVHQLLAHHCTLPCQSRWNVPEGKGSVVSSNLAARFPNTHSRSLYQMLLLSVSKTDAFHRYFEAGYKTHVMLVAFPQIF